MKGALMKAKRVARKPLTRAEAEQWAVDCERRAAEYYKWSCHNSDFTPDLDPLAARDRRHSEELRAEAARWRRIGEALGR
jgi:hypothetical protein